ncbi:MAG: hypothetical protein SFZ24_01185 [Planctomycetota bacterium]|nr:hypothetical protein [Planctomycetota bacterium]
MSPVPNDPEFIENGAEAAPQAMPVEEPRRAASLTLRVDDAREARAASMDAANKSLTDALRITYRLLQVVMIGLVALFLFSGFQQVNQAERGIRVELGRIKSDNLEPGFQFSLPYPLGEIIKVETGNRTVELDDSFWPGMRPEDRRRPLEEVGNNIDRLDPARDGSLFTADSNIAHAQYSVVYTRSRPADYIKNINTDQEAALVKAVVERAVVQVAASVVVDDLLKPGASGSGTNESSVETRIRATAQRSLDEIDAGLEISQVIQRTATAPLNLRRDFNQVQIAQSNAGKARDQALGDRSKTLNEAAGSAAQPLLDLIDLYEAAIELNDRERAEEILGVIDSVLAGEKNGANVEIAGTMYPEIRVSGQAATMMSEAAQYRSTVVQQAQRAAETFQARLQQYRANPAVFLTSAISDGLQSFLASDRTDQVVLSTDNFELLLSPDPEFAKERERARYERDVESNERVREMRESLE